MNEQVRPEDAEHAEVPTGASEDPREQDEQDGQDPEAPDQDAAGPAADGRRRRVVPWVRLGVAALVGGALVAASSLDGAGLRVKATGDRGSEVVGASDPMTYLEASFIACPGPDRSGEVPAGLTILASAAAAPAEVFHTPPVDGDQALDLDADPDTGLDVDPGTGLDADPAGEGVQDEEPAAADDPSQGEASPSSGHVQLRLTGEGGPESEEGDPGSEQDFRDGQINSVPVERSEAVLIEGTGPAAPGLVGGQVVLDRQPGGRGLTLTPCTQAVETAWLTGGGAEPGRSETLVLTNPSADPVTVTLDVWGSDGPVPTTGATGLVVPGHGRSVHALDAIAPGADAPVVRVSTTGGPVVAHLGELYRDGTTARGIDTSTALAAPDTDLVVPALPVGELGDGAVRRTTLRIVAPGDQEAVVDVRALTETGAASLNSVTRVPAGQVVEVILDDLPAGAVALRLRSDEPVTAAARLEIEPSSEPLEPSVDEASSTAAPGDEASSTAASGDAVSGTAAPGDAASSTAAPGDEASSTAGPEDDDGMQDQREPILHPAGDLAWVGATAVSTTPLGMAVPQLAGPPADDDTDTGSHHLEDLVVELAITAVDATRARVIMLDAEGAVHSLDLSLGNDTTYLLHVQQSMRAVWVRPTDPDTPGLAASLHMSAPDADPVGPYVAATTLPTVPWQRDVTRVRVLVP